MVRAVATALGVVGFCLSAAACVPLPPRVVVASETIHCCCGDHDVAHACHCLDCPAHEMQLARRDAGDRPGLRACGRRHVLTLASLAPPARLAEPGSMRTPDPVRVAPPGPARRPKSRVIPVDEPPS